MNVKVQARQPTIGQLVDDAIAGIERDNPALKRVLPRGYAHPALDKTRLGQLIDISNIRVADEASYAKDVLGHVYEYFLSQFGSAEGKKAGEFYTHTRPGEAAGRDARAASQSDEGPFPNRNADFILLNPPFNDGNRRGDSQWKHGTVRIGPDCRQARHCVEYAG